MCRPTTRRSPPKFSGYVASIPVDDNTPVHAGDVIATIDDGDYRLAVDAARDKVATQQATIDRIGHQIIAQEAAVLDQAKAQLVSAQAAARRTQLEFDRQQTCCAAQNASSRQQHGAGARPTATRPWLGAEGAQAAHRPRPRPISTCSRRSSRKPSRTLDELQDRARQGRARPVVHRDPRAGRRRVRQSRGADRRLCADRAARSRAWCRSPTSISTPISRRRSSRASARPAGLDHASTRCPNIASRARSKASRRRRARCSRCCRPTTRPATSPRSCSGCRCASMCPPSVAARRTAAARHVGRRQRRTPSRARLADNGTTRRRAQSRVGALIERAQAAASWPPPAARIPAADPRAGASVERVDPAAPAVAFLAMCFGMFMAFLDIQIVSASLSRSRPALPASSDEISWVQTVVSDRRSGRHSAVRLPVARARHARPVRDLRRRLHRRELHVRFRLLDRADDPVARDPGLYRRRHGADGVRLRLSDLSAPRQPLVTPIIGLVATLAPTIGPTVGGYLTDAMSWHWLFFINVVPGIVVTIAALALVDFDKPDFALLDHFDWSGLISMARLSRRARICAGGGPALRVVRGRHDRRLSPSISALSAVVVLLPAC